MTQYIPEVDNTSQINSAEFVKLTVFNDFSNTANTSTYTFSSAYKPEIIDGATYLPLGGLLAVGAQNRDLRVTAGDTTISLSGVSGNNIDNDILGNTYLRFTGIVTGYGITEERDGNEDNFTVAVSASSYKTVLQNRIAGRKTNQESWQFFDPTDTSMNQVYSIAGVDFDFGKEPTNRQIIPGGGGGRGGENFDFNTMER